MLKINLFNMNDLLNFNIKYNINEYLYYILRIINLIFILFNKLKISIYERKQLNIYINIYVFYIFLQYSLFINIYIYIYIIK